MDEALWDELPFTVDACVGALAGDLLLLLWDTARRWGRPTRVQGTWDSLQEWREERQHGRASKRWGKGKKKEEKWNVGKQKEKLGGRRAQKERGIKT